MLRSLRSRMLVAFLAPSLALFAIAGIAGYAVVRGILEDELGRSLSRVAASAAAELNAERLLGIEAGDDVNGTRTWRNALRSLEAVRDAAGARRIFAVDAEGRVRVDAGGTVPVGERLAELERDRNEVARALAGELAASQLLFEGSDGRLYKTGYAPVRAADGQVVALIGVEGTTEFFGPIDRLFRAYALLVAVGLAVLAAIALLTARRLSRPLNRLVNAALRIGRGDLQTPVQGEATREIGILASELESMRRALESRDRQLKMMLAGVAHEVRNPIGGIELFAGVLAEELEGQPGEARSHVERIRGELAYLKRIVEEFLAFARDQRVNAAPVDAAAMVSSAAALMTTDAGQKQLELQVRTEPATLSGDPTLLTSAVTNLIKNAIQAAPERSAVEISAAPRDGAYEIRVTDHGAGVAPELREKIFEPFFTTREKGTGLGLALARKILHAHGGSLELDAAAEKGQTTFAARVPLGATDGPAR